MSYQERPLLPSNKHPDHLLHLPHPTSLLKSTQIFARHTLDVYYLLLFDKDSSFIKHKVFPYSCAAEASAAIPPQPFET